MILLSTTILALIMGIGIFFTIMSIITIVVCITEGDDVTVTLIPIAVAAVSIFVVVCSAICTCAAYDDNINIEDTRLESTVPLYSLGSGGGVHGHFVFGCGSVDDIQYYIGYTNTGDNAYMQVKYDASVTTLRLDDNETPRAETYSCWVTYPTAFPFIGVDGGRVVQNVVYIPTDGLSNTYAVN